MLSPHLYILIGAVALFFMFIAYGYVYDHKEYISDSQEWLDRFRKARIPDAISDDISHDEDVWYYRGASTCIAYGDWSEKCPRHECYCAGNDKIGTGDQQALAIAEALRNGGQHSGCPLQYVGAN